MSFYHRFKAGDKVVLDKLGANSTLMRATGIYGGDATYDGRNVIIILDNPLPDQLAVCVPADCVYKR